MIKKLLAIALIIIPSLAQSHPEPVGFYSNGNIINAQELPTEGKGYMRLFLNRHRGWGSFEMLYMLEATAMEIHSLHPGRDRLQVGDISQLGGGKITRHNSHQNGLDVDLSYYRLNNQEQDVRHESGFAEDMVIKGKISPNFDYERNWLLFKTLHQHGNVQRIFVDQVIKNEICHYAYKIKENIEFHEVLRSLRPFTNHAHHLHVRITCPERAVRCEAQADIPTGDGC